MPSLSVLVMAFNEAANLEAVVRELDSAVRALPGARQDEIVIIDDGSSDDTGLVADRLAASLPGVRVVHHDVNRGLGGVYRTGFEEARGDLLTFFPADGQFPATIIQAFYPLMETHDLVLGYLPRRQSSALAKGLSAAEKLLYRGLFGPMPRYQGIFMLRRPVLSALTLVTEGRGWGVVMEMVLKVFRGPYRVTSVPTTLRPRMSGQSKVNNPRTIWINLKQALALRRTLRSGA
jgi:glycosyltransferase involved in cell wall biosynthesis